MTVAAMAVMAIAASALGNSRVERPPTPAAMGETLSPAEVAAGWVDVFDRSTTFGWRTTGSVTVEDGYLVIDGRHGAASATTMMRLIDAEFHLRLTTNRVVWVADQLALTAPTPCDLRIVRDASGRQVITHFPGENAEPRISDWPTANPPGIALPLTVTAQLGEVLRLAWVRARPTATKALFNGRDLTGWRAAPNRASVWTVKPDGVLHVANGPGDLQTTEQWADFVLQLDVFTHGPGLNSGVFFRALPGAYQQGYEAQIQNAVHGGDRTRPVDFGTGAIYRRVAARRVVSDDNAWFTMTVMAVGADILTWVNGYPVVAWRDDRPPDDNPRRGLRTGPGCLSIQGHDPTTDISLRHIRLADLAGPRPEPNIAAPPARDGPAHGGLVPVEP